MDRIRRTVERLRQEHGFGIAEALIALTILVIGLVAVSGLSLASAGQARIAKWRAEQATAGQIVLEQVQDGGWAAAAAGTDTVSVSGHDYEVKVTVADVTSRVRQVTAVVAAVGEVNSRTFTTRVYRPRPLPSASPVGAGGGGGTTPPPDTTTTPPPDTTTTPPPDTTTTPPPQCPPGQAKKGKC